MIVSDLFAGDGEHAASWIVVALKSNDKPRWVLRTDALSNSTSKAMSG